MLTGSPEGAPLCDAAHRRSSTPACDPLLTALEWRRHGSSGSSSSSSRMATDAELGLVHPPAYLAAIRSACATLTSTGALLDLLDLLLGRPPEPPSSRSGADDGGSRRSGGGTVAGGSSSSRRGGSSAGSSASRPPPAAGFALVRPPGHHVLPTRPMGFGVFNTIAVAARYARERHGVGRVLVVDFDVHHGNGTQEIFYQDPDTLYISTHQATAAQEVLRRPFDTNTLRRKEGGGLAGLWPYTGKAKEAGAGAGRGATINIPLPGGSGDQAMARVRAGECVAAAGRGAAVASRVAAWSRVVLPAAERFRPQLVLVSAGYDAHWRDPLASMQLTAGTYHWLALVLEGGYDTASLAESVAASLCGLLLLPPPVPLLPLPGPPPPPQRQQQHRPEGDHHHRTAAVMLQPPGPRELYEEPLARVDAVLEEVCRIHGLQ
ncbi:hypothetical protein HXX76_016036 [Chlamydomonas incerta]|uniref:Histone deacetylase domain-containing protein n=1 Tax=Chlamydomonas incerta TaxID=51695 RepID=A0A835SLZ3_CHLIN|nr:hypothetical protein HXX76_016036 [Chlamydomonas incerta]|eukprot:KAG2422421.1 hypothetical protein HXX76_016036 [Chlamydomonas incerta]